MTTIRVDEEVYRFLQDRARPFVDSPNDVLRRLLIDGADAKPPGLQPARPPRSRERESDKGYVGKDIRSFTFGGTRYPVQTWKGMLRELCGILAVRHSAEFTKVLSLRGPNRPYFSRNPREMTGDPKRIANSDIFAETKLNASDIVRNCRDVLALFGYSSNDLVIEAS